MPPKSATPRKPWWEDWGLTYLPDAYGPVAGGHTVQEAMYRTIEKWLPAYIMEVNRKLGGNILNVPKEYRRKPDHRPLTKGVDVQIMVSVDGTATEPERKQDATYTCWNTTVTVFIWGTQDWQETQALTFAYAACVRAAIIQHPGLETDGTVSGVLWKSEEYKEGEHSSMRQVGLATIKFEVTTPNAVDPWGGPPLNPYAAAGTITGPSLLPPSPLPVVETAKTTITGPNA